MKPQKKLVDMPDAEYFAVDAASNSTLGRMKPTPAHCLAYLDSEEKEPTPAMAFGSLVHCVVLEPDSFTERYAIAPEGINRRTNAGKAEWAEFEASTAGKIVITKEDSDTASAMADVVSLHPAASKLLGKGVAERAGFWIDEETGELCKSKFDFVNDAGYVVDYKTTIDASIDEFSRSIAKFGYHRQQAIYKDGYTAIIGKPPKGFVFIAQEKKPPYAVGVFLLDEESEDQGREEYRELLKQYSACKNSNAWPAYPSTVQEISLPRWAKKGI